jgi:hypothetical protein
MSASTEIRPPARTSFWTSEGAVYAVFCLVGLAVGLWPDAIYPPHDPTPSVTLPALRTLVVSQIAFVLLAWPPAILRRAERGRLPSLPSVAVEGSLLLAFAIPFFVAAAWVADAVALDVIRCELYVLGVMPAGVAAGWWMARSPAFRPWIQIVLLIAVLGVPAAWYAAREFLTPEPLHALWNVGPASFAWSLAASRQGVALARPLWAALVWPIAGIAAMLATALVPRREGAVR